jgi:hypothetical protein
VIVVVRPFFFVAGLVGLGALGWTALHDDAGLEAEASELACRGHQCTAALAKKTRALFGWTYTFTTYGDQNLLVDVTCARSLWVVGGYHCDVSEADHTADRRFLPK